MSAMPKSMYPPGFEKKVVKTFKHIFDALESETSGKDVDIANQQFSLLDKQMAADPTLENKNPQSRDWICHLIDERYDVLKTPFGTIYVRSTISKLKSRYFQNQYQYEHETSFTVCPAWWFVKVGFTYVPQFTLFNSTIHGWKYELSSFRSVPDNALIFEFCTTGNLSGVQALLAWGEASVKDVDSTGKTALHFISYRVDAKKTDRTPLLAAADHNNEVIIDVADAIDTIRLFSDSLDFFDHRGSGWSTLVLLLWNLSVSLPDGVSIDDIKRDPLILWMLRLQASDIKETFRKETCPFLKALLSLNDEEETSDLLLTLTHQLTDSKGGLGKYIPLQIVICYVYAVNDMIFGVNLMLMKGANLHLASDRFIFSGESETPTSLALYSSFTFVKWRDALLRSSVDLEKFVEDEVQQSPLKDTGWNKVSLLALFRCDIQSDNIPPIDCDDCPESVSYIPLELSWREWLSRFKEKPNTGNSSNDEYSAYFGGESRFFCVRCYRNVEAAE
ncbi:hypothetical protein MMC22_008516 [Lobaria immixta]|nr:hypothetical protein [Lobaria immixta]